MVFTGTTEDKLQESVFFYDVDSIYLWLEFSSLDLSRSDLLSQLNGLKGIKNKNVFSARDGTRGFMHAGSV